ncbi:hypothetical protein NKH53_25695 [Mesorhizobium australicum]|uniref:hypothetical protein n=1 Tax=Mesorhizobium australicum TaxID=536018 RepID=UPI003339E4BF
MQPALLHQPVMCNPNVRRLHDIAFTLIPVVNASRSFTAERRSTARPKVPSAIDPSLALVVVGLLMVEPKQEAEEEPPLLDDCLEEFLPQLDPLLSPTQ